MDFVDAIQEALGSCAVLVALIGHQWATAADEEGRRRLGRPNDFVRFEVQTALERGAQVIPVLIDGAMPLQDQDLPPELQGLTSLHALELRYGRYEYHAARLVEAIERVLAGAQGNSTYRPSPSPPDAQPERKGSEALRDDTARAARALDDAESAARSITDQYAKAQELADVAKALGLTDRNRAARLFADAERVARSIARTSAQAGALLGVVEALTPGSDGREGQLITNAERIAQAISHPGRKAQALASVAGGLAATDRDHAALMLADAVGITQSLAAQDRTRRVNPRPGKPRSCPSHSHWRPSGRTSAPGWPPTPSSSPGPSQMTVREQRHLPASRRLWRPRTPTAPSG